VVCAVCVMGFHEGFPSLQDGIGRGKDVGQRHGMCELKATKSLSGSQGSGRREADSPIRRYRHRFVVIVSIRVKSGSTWSLVIVYACVKM
jgi:hypothetical protein